MGNFGGKFVPCAERTSSLTPVAAPLNIKSLLIRRFSDLTKLSMRDDVLCH